MRARDVVGGPLSALATVLLYSIPLVAMPGVLPPLFRPPAFLELPSTYDPEGMLEGEGEEDAPDDPVEGEPAVVTLYQPPQAPAPGEVVDVPAPEVPVAPAEPVEAVVAPVVPAPVGTPVAPAPSEPDPPKKGGGEGATKGTGPKPPPEPKAPVGNADPEKVKDIGDKGNLGNAGPGCQEPHPQIEKVADGTWTIQRDLIDYYTSSIAVFNTLGYSRKYEEGDQKGWYIAGFGCKSPLYKAGLRSKDVVQAINGRKTNNVLQIFGIWTTMRKKGDFEVQVLRKGKVVLLHYKVE